MFNIRRTKKEDMKETKDIQKDLARFTGRIEASGKTEFIENLITENKFIKQDMEMRAMVESVLANEFSSEIKSLKSYDLIVDAVINKLKKDQIGE